MRCWNVGDVYHQHRAHVYNPQKRPEYISASWAERLRSVINQAQQLEWKRRGAVMGTPSRMCTIAYNNNEALGEDTILLTEMFELEGFLSRHAAVCIGLAAGNCLTREPKSSNTHQSRDDQEDPKKKSLRQWDVECPCPVINTTLGERDEQDTPSDSRIWGWYGAALRREHGYKRRRGGQGTTKTRRSAACVGHPHTMIAAPPRRRRRRLQVAGLGSTRLRPVPGTTHAADTGFRATPRRSHRLPVLVLDLIAHETLRTVAAIMVAACAAHARGAGDRMQAGKSSGRHAPLVAGRVRGRAVRRRKVARTVESGAAGARDVGVVLGKRQAAATKAAPAMKNDLACAAHANVLRAVLKTAAAWGRDEDDVRDDEHGRCELHVRLAMWVGWWWPVGVRPGSAIAHMVTPQSRGTSRASGLGRERPAPVSDFWTSSLQRAASDFRIGPFPAVYYPGNYSPTPFVPDFSRRPMAQIINRQCRHWPVHIGPAHQFSDKTPVSDADTETLRVPHFRSASNPSRF
ncbi:hypothetical protein GGX14DRAFT_401093 [Mycena pura]|uniref:Uncharacterized protein n=1 Tax=Mycena pura TaxID=153505 RepID=A0AAD6V3K1_9AGAR|nr:hypothetical protein GGX14DRAFT_401093 [Mycena pura]